MSKIRKHFNTSPHNVLADSDTAINFGGKAAKKSLGRKDRCPGAAYDWTVLENAGNATKPAAGATVPHKRYDDFFLKSPEGAIHVKATKVAIAGVQQTLAELGYFVNRNSTFDLATERAVQMFQIRYFSGPSRAAALAAARASKGADLATVTRMHEVLAARAGFTYV